MQQRKWSDFLKKTLFKTPSDYALTRIALDGVFKFIDIMSKQLFELMQMQEIASSNFLPNKKEIEFNAKTFAKKLLDEGEFDKYEAFAQAERATLAFSSVRDVLKSSLPREKNNAFGIEINPVNGRQMIQYSEDLVWSELKEKLTEREELLKTSLKITGSFYDSEGVEVPKVSVKYSADSITVKY